MMEPAGCSCTTPTQDAMFFTLSLSLSLVPRKLFPNEDTHTHTHTHARHTLAAFLNATHLKTQLAQIIKINTLEAWHYAKETLRFFFFERNLIKNY